MLPCGMFEMIMILTRQEVPLLSYLQPVEKRADMDTGYSRLERVSQDLFNRGGWWPNNRITCFLFFAGRSMYPLYVTFELVNTLN